MEDLKQNIENSNLIYAAMRNFPNPKLISDETINISDKILTVPANKIWEILSIWIEFTTIDYVGNRQMQIDIRDTANDVIYSLLALNVQIKVTTEYYAASQNGQEPVETVATRHFIPLPPRLLLPASFDIRIYDFACIRPSNDLLVIQMMVNEWDVS